MLPAKILSNRGEHLDTSFAAAAAAAAAAADTLAAAPFAVATSPLTRVRSGAREPTTRPPARPYRGIEVAGVVAVPDGPTTRNQAQPSHG